VTWQGLIVDEGQRLKNDKTLLYSALGQLKAPFRILLTGTPLQNNQRELFNLLHFLDDTYDAAQLEKEYEELDANKIGELHEMIRPFFLRRTKAQVLTFLPPMAQIIVPVSMTIVQKRVYRTILAKNPELMKAIFSSEATLKEAERASLSNILMQLRKCLCHPFVYNKSIEERNVTLTTSHRNLVDASAKLKLLELLLPKLQERGHRVLIFSQFLDMLDIVEDFLDGMQLRYQRLDGSINALQKQKRIDEFNAPDSPLFAFILSTRAGGVGINLASADTVIILDPDFNPHQDIQALSRAHRIGQSKKVLCFQLVTRASAEERIMQMGRKKLALDHVLIQEMDADDADQNDLVSVLRHGASELFEDVGDQDITYDSSSVERLLDRSHMEDTKAGEDKSAETQFSFARVWANNQGALQDEMAEEVPEEQAPDPNVWANILRERERLAAEEATAKADAYGRGRRARGNIDYGNEPPEGVEGLEITPMKKRRNKSDDASDTDFQDNASSDGEDVEDGETLGMDDVAIASEGAKRETGRKKDGKSKPSPKNPLPTPVSTRRKPIPLSKARGSISLLGRQPRASKPKTTAKPKAAPKSPSEDVKKSNGASGESMRNEESEPAPKASETNVKKKNRAAKGKKEPYPGQGQFKADVPKDGQTSTSPMKKSESAGVTVAQPDTRGRADDPIVLSDDDEDAALS
jgi:superfamily II DNA or RNA helicase